MYQPKLLQNLLTFMSCVMFHGIYLFRAFTLHEAPLLCEGNLLVDYSLGHTHCSLLTVFNCPLLCMLHTRERKDKDMKMYQFPSVTVTKISYWLLNRVPPSPRGVNHSRL